MSKIILTGKITMCFFDILTRKKRIKIYKNLIPNTGLNAIVRRLANAGTKTNEGVITYGAVGLGTTAATATDTILENEYYRKEIANATISASILYIYTYFTPTQAVGSLKEFGLFGEDATSLPDTGTLFQRVIIDEEKIATEALTIESTITLTYGG